MASIVQKGEGATKIDKWPPFEQKTVFLGNFAGAFGAARKFYTKAPQQSLKTAFLGISISNPLYIFGNPSMTQLPVIPLKSIPD